MTLSEKEELQKAIGKHIKALRESKGIAQRTLALDCGIEPPNFARLESGGTNPTLYTLKKIADHLDIPLTDIVKF